MLRFSESLRVAVCSECRAGGDVFWFVMKTRNVTFPEALAILESGLRSEDER
jgi:DNA primase